MARRVIVGSRLIVDPPDEGAEGYTYFLSTAGIGTLDEYGIFTAVSPGYTAIMVRRTADGVIVRRMLLQVLTQEQADAVATGSLPTFTLQIDPPTGSQ